MKNGQLALAVMTAGGCGLLLGFLATRSPLSDASKAMLSLDAPAHQVANLPAPASSPDESFASPEATTPASANQTPSAASEGP